MSLVLEGNRKIKLMGEWWDILLSIYLARQGGVSATTSTLSMATSRSEAEVKYGLDILDEEGFVLSSRGRYFLTATAVKLVGCIYYEMTQIYGE